MATIMKRDKEGNVDLPENGLKFKVSSQHSALGVIGTSASTIQHGDEIYPPFIYREGKRLPYMVLRGEEGRKISLDSMLEYDVTLAEQTRWDLLCVVRDKYLPAFIKAWHNIQKCRIAHTSRSYSDGSGKNKVSYVSFRVSDRGVSWDWLQKKPAKLMNEAKAKAYFAAEEVLSEWEYKLRVHGEVFERALFHNYPRYRSPDRREDVAQQLVIFIINSREYIYLDTYEGLKKFAWPEPWATEPLLRKTITNKLDQWPFSGDPQ